MARETQSRREAGTEQAVGKWSGGAQVPFPGGRSGVASAGYGLGVERWRFGGRMCAG